jgi:hypothetical protein
MAGLLSLDDAIAKMTGANERDPLISFKSGRVQGAAGVGIIRRQYSLWEYEGFLGAGAHPGAVAVPDSTTAGGFQQPNPGGGRQLWLTNVAVTSIQTAGALVIYDRLLHVGGLSGTVTSAQAVGGSLTRYTGSQSYDNEVWIEISQAIGATPTTFTVSYTNQLGNAVVSPSHAIGGTGFREVGRFIPMPCAALSTGVQGVTSITFAGTTGTTGAFALVVARPLVMIPCSLVGVGIAVDMIEAINEVLPDACLATYWHSTNTTPATGLVQLSMVES